MKHAIHCLSAMIPLLWLGLQAGPALAGTAAEPATLTSYATFHSLGFEYRMNGDDDHDAVCRVEYRKQGSGDWKEFLPLFRIDYQPPEPVNGEAAPFNGFGGSILFLEPGTTYEVRLTLTDPDGGSTTRTLAVATRALPQKPAGGRMLHVVPGAGGGSGTAADPFQGIPAAQAAARPGDIFLLHQGRYTGSGGQAEVEFRTGGTAGAYIVWQAAGDGEVIMEKVRIAADYLWLEGVHVAGHPEVADEFGLLTYDAPRGVVIQGNRFTDFNYAIALNHGGEDWWIVGNTIIGDKDVIGVEDGPPSFRGEGIELEHTSGHTIAWNSISRVADGISYPHRNCDIFGNDIFDVTDDGIEPDYGYANIRIWQNRISNARHAGISFQPMNGGPWYIIRNQVAAGTEALKLRQSSRAAILHNLFVGWKGVQAYGAEWLLHFQSNNNLWVSVTDRYVWENMVGGSAGWRTALDYDGFDWADSTYAFKWGAENRYTSLEAFQSATGLQPHGLHIRRQDCFAVFDIPAAPPASMPFQYMTLKEGCNAVDSGTVLAGINEDFRGSAPDLGPYELGAPLPRYGPVNNSSGPTTSGTLNPASFALLLLRR